MSQAMTHEPPGRHQSRKAAASGWIGSALEYYDFFIYATAASLIFPQTFFPSSNPTVAIVASLATYGVGYVARPIGAIVLGHWGDRHGRKNVMLVCLFLMGASTMAVGLLPTYQQAGVWAPILLVTLRLIQGFAVAGEISGASSMILEHAPFGRRGYFASFTLQGVQAGQILAAAVFLPLSYALSKEDFFAWGWRVPFLLSVFVVIAGYVIRREVDETPAFAEEQAHREIPKAPVVDALTNHGGRHASGRLHGADERHTGGRDHLRRGLRGAARLRRRNGQERLSVDPGHRQHRRGGRDPVRRRPFRPHRPPSADHRRLSAVGSAVVRLPLCDQHQERAARIRLLDPDVGRRLPGLQRGLSELLPGTLSDPGARLRDGDLAKCRHHADRALAGGLRRHCAAGIGQCAD